MNSWVIVHVTMQMSRTAAERRALVMLINTECQAYEGEFHVQGPFGKSI